jgi:hypothetical protein
MRMLLNVTIPHHSFNAAVKDGSISGKVSRIVESMKAESIYFTERDGHRSAIVVVDVPEPSSIPALAEPWFLTFEADVEFHIAMTPDDLARAGLEECGRKWSGAAGSAAMHH